MRQAAQDSKWSMVSLRIFSDTRRVEEMSPLLGVAPSRSYEKGQLVTSRHPTARRGCHAWMLENGLGQDHDIASQVSWLLGFSSESGQGGTTLDHGLLVRLAKLPLNPVLDLYPPGPIKPE
jgi:hypothetical protein